MLTAISWSIFSYCILEIYLSSTSIPCNLTSTHSAGIRICLSITSRLHGILSTLFALGILELSILSRCLSMATLRIYFWLSSDLDWNLIHSFTISDESLIFEALSDQLLHLTTPHLFIAVFTIFSISVSAFWSHFLLYSFHHSLI